MERERCLPPPPPAPPPPKDDSMFWAAMGLLVLGGGFVIYAKQNPEIRDWLSIRAPWVDDLIAILYQENMTYAEYAAHFGNKVKKALIKLKLEKIDKPQIEGKLVNTGADSHTKEAPEFQDKEGDYVIVNFSDPDSERDGKRTPSERKPIQEKDLSKQESCREIVPPPLLTKDICEVEKCMQDLGESAICYYTTALAACKCYNKLVQSTMVQFSVPEMRKLPAAMEERIAVVKESVEKAAAVTAKLDELSRYFDCGVTASKEAIKNTKDMAKEYRHKIETLRIQLEWENDKALARDIQWQQVDDSMTKYMDDCKTMSKGLDYESEKPQWRGDADLLLFHTFRYVHMLNDQLAGVIGTLKERSNRAMDSLLQDENKLAARKKDMEATLKIKTAELTAEFLKRVKEKNTENDKFLKDSLKEQLERSQETLEKRLKQNEIEAEAKLDKLVAEQVALERQAMSKEIGAMALKLKVIEEKLNARLKAEQETRRSQELWSAGASLLAATKKGDSIVKVDKELKAIEKASGKEDKLVLTVLKAIPESVRKKGVVPESVLRERYRVMEDVALKVALVEQNGGVLPIYILSFIQSIFLFMKIKGIPQDEFERPPKEPSKDLDTFDLLQRARFWIDRGNIAVALKYVAALEGASRAAATSWREAARSYLETRLAAEAVLAHAAALGLQYI